MTIRLPMLLLALATLHFACADAELLAPALRTDLSDATVSDTEGRSDRGRDLGVDPGRSDGTVDTGRVVDTGRGDGPSDATTGDPDSRTEPDAGDEPDAEPVCTVLDDCMSDEDFDIEMEGCGDCGGGMRSRTRRCDVDLCTWGEWEDWGACACDTPSASENRACGNCNTGSQSRSRTCQAGSCTWSAWSDYGACSGGGTCAPGQRRDSGSCDSCSQEVCSGTCTWNGTCALRAGNTCNWEAGSNWRCCGGGSWQFCLGSCRWSTDCAACTGCGC